MGAFTKCDTRSKRKFTSDVVPSRPMFSLKTVRAKLSMLVLMSSVVMLAMLPVLSYVLHTQLIEEVDDRVSDAEKSFEAELDDEFASLTLVANVLAQTGDAELHDTALRFWNNDHALQILVTDEAGKVTTTLGTDIALTGVTGIADYANVLKHHAYEGAGRCASNAQPALVSGVPIAKGGAVFVCRPITREFLENATQKLGLQLALTNEKGVSLFSTSKFPTTALAHATHESSLFQAQNRNWAVARFEPPRMKSSDAALSAVAALDVDDIRALVQKNLLFALAILILAAAISLFAGWRVASVMSRALSRVNIAVKKLEHQEYAHVDAIRTGDELEDLATGFNTMVDGMKERDKLRTTFGKYMTASVVEHLMNGKVTLGGETLPVTILFTDIRSFTSMSEHMDAQELVGRLNEYFTEMVTIVMRENGVVDKYIGDALMAVFGAPVPKPNDAIHAVTAAVGMRIALRHLNERLAARGLLPLKTGIGIHTGNVVAGNIGSESRMEYTVIGDAVNLASRLETSTKELGVDILISEDTYALVKEIVVARAVKEIHVKGREKPVMTYEVLGLKGEELLASH